ncbi:3962_t:CDS:1, partial [Gigaspora rosea]
KKSKTILGSVETNANSLSKFESYDLTVLANNSIEEKDKIEPIEQNYNNNYKEYTIM